MQGTGNLVVGLRFRSYEIAKHSQGRARWLPVCITLDHNGKHRAPIDFLKEAFDAREADDSRFVNEDGSIGHAEVRIGDSVILMFDAKPEWPTMQSLLRLYVHNADVVFEKAIKAGAEPVTKMTTLAFGDRVGRVRDPFGNIWWIQSHVEDVSAQELKKRLENPVEQESMKYVEESLEWELGKNVQHASLDRT